MCVRTAQKCYISYDFCAVHIFMLTRVFLTINVKHYEIFFVALFSYLMLAVYLSVIALSEEPIKRHKVLLAFTAFMASIYSLCYYFERVGL
jgi:ABC-type proline/glycine betaine transport system permease subunit